MRKAIHKSKQIAKTSSIIGLQYVQRASLIAGVLYVPVFHMTFTVDNRQTKSHCTSLSLIWGRMYY